VSARSAGQIDERRDPALCEQTSALCGAGERYTRWLREVEDEVRRGCAVVVRGAGAFPAVEVLISLDARDDTPSAAMWSGVRYLAEELSARYRLRVVPIRLPDAVLFRIVARPGEETAATPGRGPGRFRAWLRRRVEGEPHDRAGR
jgi:hypothetical protein